MGQGLPSLFVCNSGKMNLYICVTTEKCPQAQFLFIFIERGETLWHCSTAPPVEFPQCLLVLSGGTRD